MLKLLIKSNWFIGICACLQCIATFAFIGELVLETLFYSLSVGIATKVAYTYLRRGDTYHIYKERKKTVGQLLPLALAALLLFVLSSPPIYAYFVGAFSVVLIIMYSAHFFASESRFSFRRSALLKVIVIALVWLTTIVILPLVWSPNFPNTRHLLFLAMQLFFVLALTIPFDIHDADEESEKGFQTIPSKFGLAATNQICRALAILCWISSGFLGLSVFLIMSILIVIYLRVLHMPNKHWTKQTFILYFDGIGILQPLAFIPLFVIENNLL